MNVTINDIAPPINSTEYSSKTVYNFIESFSTTTINALNTNFTNIRNAFTNLELVSSKITFDSGIIPGKEPYGWDSVYTLGSADKPWGNIYLSGDIVPEAPISFGSSNNHVNNIYGWNVYGKEVHIDSLYGYTDPVWVYADLVPSDLTYNLGASLNRWKNAYINRIYIDSLYINNKEFDPEIYGDGFVHDNWPIKFGTEGNYKNEPFMSTLVVNRDYADNGTNNTQFKENSQIKVNVTKGGYITLEGYPGYSDYTIQINGGAPTAATGTYSTPIATTDQEIVITSKSSSNYYISLTIYNYRQITLTDAVKNVDSKTQKMKYVISDYTIEDDEINLILEEV